MAIGAAAQARGVVAAAALLHLFAVVADGRLQRVADALAVSAILRRFARSFVCHDVRGLSPALFDEHFAVVASGAAVPLLGAQRRDQHDRFQSAVASREGSGTAREADGRARGSEMLEENVSDSASFDNAFEQKLLEGFSPEAAMLSMVPPAFENDPLLSRDVRGALASLSQDSEPWDGPAALVFSDGQFVGAKLDRNGLRPLRYTLTHDGLLIAGSETGLVDLDGIANRRTPAAWPGRNDSGESGDRRGFSLARNSEASGHAAIAECAAAGAAACGNTAAGAAPAIEQPKRVAAAAGWTEDQFKILFSALPHGKEADWSMGDDAPPAFLSTLPRTLWDYCKQRFAQVTNPPIDPLRESHVMSLAVHLAERRRVAESDHRRGPAGGACPLRLVPCIGWILRFLPQWESRARAAALLS